MMAENKLTFEFMKKNGIYDYHVMNDTIYITNDEGARRETSYPLLLKRVKNAATAEGYTVEVLKL